METQTEQEQYKHFCPICKKEREFKFYDGWLGYESFICPVCNWDINDLNKEIEQENKEFMQEQTTENISLLLNHKPKAEKINKEMSLFIEGLK